MVGVLSRIGKKWRNDGIGEVVLAMARVVLRIFTKPSAWLEIVNDTAKALKSQKAAGYLAIFPSEGNLALKFPQTRLSDALSASGRPQFLDIETFRSRREREILLRRCIYKFLQDGTISRDKSIIDIGCWMGDNALPWATLLENGALVYAVDPSDHNIAFAQKIAHHNGITNIAFRREVCSDIAGIALNFDGHITQARFNEEGRGQPSGLISTTLDAVIGAENWTTIGLLHLDVEGFETKVLNGSIQIIRHGRPVIVFEQHLSREDPRVIGRWLAKESYRIFMINEVLPGCSLDCRNFIAFPESVDIPEMAAPDLVNGRREGIWYAAVDQVLIPLRL